MFLNAMNLAHYSTDYSTKPHMAFGSLGDEICRGLATLEFVGEVPADPCQTSKETFDAYEHKRYRGAWKRLSLDEQVDRGRRLITRIQTSANKTHVKKLTEICFFLIYGHECYASHRTWTLYLRRPYSLIDRAKERRRRRPGQRELRGPQ